MKPGRAVHLVDHTTGLGERPGRIGRDDVHAGEAQAKSQTWDGKKWNVQPGVYHADNSILKPMIRSSAEKYATEKKVTKRDCAKEAG